MNNFFGRAGYSHFMKSRLKRGFACHEKSPINKKSPVKEDREINKKGQNRYNSKEYRHDD